MRVASPRRKRRRGAAVVEFAFIVPVLLLMLFGILEYSRFLFTLEVMNNAAREGARYAVVNTATVTTSDVRNYVDGYMAGQGVQLQGYSPSTNISIYQANPTTGADNSLGWQNAGWGAPIGVKITGTYRPAIPGMLWLAGSIPVQATALMYAEAN